MKLCPEVSGGTRSNRWAVLRVSAYRATVEELTCVLLAIEEYSSKGPVVMAIMRMTDWQSIVEATADMPGRSRSMYV